MKCQTPECPHDAIHRIMTDHVQIELCQTCLHTILGANREKLRNEEISSHDEMLIRGPTVLDQITKPPLGIMPRRIWIELRLQDLKCAILRATDPVKAAEYCQETIELVNQWQKEKA